MEYLGKTRSGRPVVSPIQPILIGWAIEDHEDAIRVILERIRQLKQNISNELIKTLGTHKERLAKLNEIHDAWKKESPINSSTFWPGTNVTVFLKVGRSKKTFSGKEKRGRFIQE